MKQSENNLNTSKDAAIDYMISQLVRPTSPSGSSVFKNTPPVETFKCATCSDKGFFIDRGQVVTCTDCRTYFIKHDIKKEIVEESADSLLIPPFYRDNPFNKQTLLQSEDISSEVRQKMDFKYYANQLENILDHYRLGIKLTKSYIIMSPQGNGKNHFVYSCMYHGLQKGYSVAPYLDTEELLVMRMTAPLKFKELIQKDILFVKVLVSYTDIEDTEMIKYIVEKRGRLNLPTVVVSRFNMKYLSSIEPHLTNTMGLIETEKYDYSKLEALSSVFMSEYQEYKQSRDHRLDRLYRVHRLPCSCQTQHGKSNYNNGFPLANSEANSLYYKDSRKNPNPNPKEFPHPNVSPPNGPTPPMK